MLGLTCSEVEAEALILIWNHWLYRWGTTYYLLCVYINDVIKYTITDSPAQSLSYSQNKFYKLLIQSDEVWVMNGTKMGYYNTEKLPTNNANRVFELQQTTAKKMKQKGGLGGLPAKAHTRTHTQDAIIGHASTHSDAQNHPFAQASQNDDDPTLIPTRPITQRSDYPSSIYSKAA
jgi:hypothetical protein